MGCILLLEGIITSEKGKIPLAIIWVVLFSTITVYDFKKDKEKKQKIALDGARENFGNQGIFSLKDKSFILSHLEIGTDYVWRQEKLKANLFRGVWVRVIRRTKNRVVIEIINTKHISTVNGDFKVNLRQDRKYVKLEDLYPGYAIDWIEFDNQQPKVET